MYQMTWLRPWTSSSLRRSLISWGLHSWEEHHRYSHRTQPSRHLRGVHSDSRGPQTVSPIPRATFVPSGPRGPDHRGEDRCVHTYITMYHVANLVYFSVLWIIN